MSNSPIDHSRLPSKRYKNNANFTLHYIQLTITRKDEPANCNFGKYNFLILGYFPYPTISQAIVLLGYFANAQDPPFTCSGAKSRKCNSCTSYLFCASKDADPVERKCTEPRSYCTLRDDDEDDMCTPAADPLNDECGGSSNPDFKCPSHPGYYPDLVNCQTFHICKDDKHAENTCLNGEIWDSVTNNCAKSKTCYTVTATDCITDTQFPYDPNHQFYIDCWEGKPYIDRCLHGEIFDVNLGCYYKCMQGGSFAHENKGKYYVCGGKNEIGVAKKCPEFTEFNPALGFCDINFLLLLGHQNSNMRSLGAKMNF